MVPLNKIDEVKKIYLKNLVKIDKLNIRKDKEREESMYMKVGRKKYRE
jgi:hypothetical protein